MSFTNSLTHVNTVKPWLLQLHASNTSRLELKRKSVQNGQEGAQINAFKFHFRITKQMALHTKKKQAKNWSKNLMYHISTPTGFIYF